MDHWRNTPPTTDEVRAWSGKTEEGAERIWETADLEREEMFVHRLTVLEDGTVGTQGLQAVMWHRLARVWGNRTIRPVLLHPDGQRLMRVPWPKVQPSPFVELLEGLKRKRADVQSLIDRAPDNIGDIDQIRRSGRIEGITLAIDDLERVLKEVKGER